MKPTSIALLAICFCLVSCSTTPKLSEKPLPMDFKSLKVLAEKGDARAQFNLANMYVGGQGVKRDLKEAMKWWRKAAKQNHAPAQTNLGNMYNNGEVVEQDFKEAMKWWRKAAEQGNFSSQDALGYTYANGRGVEQDDVTAYAWWNIAASNGHLGAKSHKDKLAKGMTPAQIAKGQKLSKEMVKLSPKLLKKK